MVPKLLLGLLGLGAAAALMGSSSSASAKSGAATPTPRPSSPSSSTPSSSAKLPGPEDLSAIAAALASADPAKMRGVATELEARGFPDQARDLRTAAQSVENAIKGAPGLPMPPASSSPGSPTTGAAPKDDPARQLGGRVALSIATASKGKENKSLVAEFQRTEQARNMYDGKIDGLWGPKSAIALAQDFGIVPPKPLYWPVNPAPAKAAYKAELLAIARRDPPRAEEWQRAAMV